MTKQPESRRILLAAATCASLLLLVLALPARAQSPAPATDSQISVALEPEDSWREPQVELQSLTGEGPDDDARAFDTQASFYHIPASALTPVDSVTRLVYDSMGCIHASAGGSSLLNAPLEVPSGSQLVLLRLYYDDTSTTANVTGWITRYNEAGTDFTDLVAVTSAGSSGHGSAYGDLDHVVDTYNYRYVLVARFNGSSTQLQVCGLRVMYYGPAELGPVSDSGGPR